MTEDIVPAAVILNEYGDVDVLNVVDVPRPAPGPGQVLVRVRAAGINPVEIKIRDGDLRNRWPSTFPSGQGSDFAGTVVELGDGVTTTEVGDSVIGFVHTRSSHAEFVVAEAENIVPKPDNVTWETVGGLYVVGTSAYAAVRAVGLTPSDTVVVSAAAGGVGSLAVQLAKHAGATVIGIAGPANHEWLTAHGVIPVAHGDAVDGDRVVDRIRAVAPNGVDAFVDTYGGGYVEIALELGVPADRINTIVDFAAAEKYGVQAKGNSEAATADVLAELAGLLSKGELELPVAAVYPLSDVRAAYRELARGHTRGKIVLLP
ncbi:MAG TPA: NADP-dependent oxidoreductase [Pseudonocardiaceae bacterium]|jgi:NADPH:quinone reductase-like Zn-dependent oxidoreductase|nr:NADP-dependent oxidoreductase [Pseudonocardiaceae bacterium]